jgi:hypothetical protein
LPVRRLLALALTLTAAVAALPSGAAAQRSITPAPGRFARCAPGVKVIDQCPDVISYDSVRKGEIQFQLNKRYCSEMPKESPGAWRYYPQITFTGAGFRKTFVYHSQGDDTAQDAIVVEFKLTGTYTSAKRLVLHIVGKVTKTVATTADCAHVKFDETHVLHNVAF